MPTGSRQHVVIVGGGFGGLFAAKEFVGTDIDVTLIDRTNHHLFAPLLYQVATAALSPGDIAQPLRTILRHAPNIHVVMSNVTSIDTDMRRVYSDDGTFTYDALILAPGNRHSYYGRDEWEQFAPGLKSVDDALRIREKLLVTFEEAEHHVGRPTLKELLTFVIIGAGPTGVELAGAIAEIATHTMLPDFPKLKRSDIRVVLLEGGDRVLSSFAPELSEKARLQLAELGVDVRTQHRVTNINEHGVTTQEGFIPSRNVIWAAGNEASPLLKNIPGERDRQGRMIIDKDLSVPGLDDVYVIGDAARMDDESGRPLPGVCQVAMQQGTFVAKRIIRHRRDGIKPHFSYNNKGNMATIGRARAIAELKRTKWSGFIAWTLWATIHIFFLIGFRNRMKVMIEWLWYYMSFQPGARLILGRNDGDSSRSRSHIDLHETA